MTMTPAVPTHSYLSPSMTSSQRPKVSAVLTGVPLLSDVGVLLDQLDSDSGDASSFDPVAFLNKNFANELILSNQLPYLRKAVGERMEKLDDRISTALQRQSETAAATRKHVQDAKASVAALEKRIKQVQDKASQSEKAVLEITQDMKRLDYAKRHLQRTITTLKQLHMLVHAVEQLRLCTSQQPFPDYKTASHLMDATRLLLSHFSGYTQKVEPMRILSVQVQRYETHLKDGLIHGFRVVAFGTRKALELQEKKKPGFKSKKIVEMDDDSDHQDNTVAVMSVKDMQGGVLVFDALGDSTRAQFIHIFCEDYLEDYVKEFEPPSPDTKPEKRVSSFKATEARSESEKSFAGLDQLEKRYSWFRDLLEKQINTKFRLVFPDNWNLQATLASMFLELTRDHVLALLDGPRKDADANNATILLKALQKTILFEKDITAYLQREFHTVFNGSDTAERCDVQFSKPLLGITSAAFEPYMSPYIGLEEQKMDEQLVEALEDRTVDTRGERPVFISSTNLFVTIKGSIARCTALTKGNAFFLLYQAFKDSLRKYAQILNGKLPTVLPSSAVVVGLSLPGTFGGKQDQNVEASYRLPAGEEITVCHVISTCDYCADTVEALEDLIRDTIDEEYQDKIDMMSDQEVFHETTAKSIRVLVSGLCNRLDGALKSMAAMNWGTWDAVGEESSYVRSIHEEIQPMVLQIRGLLPASYFRSFCDKFASQLISLYSDNLLRLKRISEPGTQQILLDVYSVKTLLLKLPVLEDGKSHKSVATGTALAPAMYTKMVQKQFSGIETLLKLVGTPNDLLIDNFKVQTSNGKPIDLQVVMNLKGLKRNEQVNMLEKYGLDPVSALKSVTSGLTSATIVSERVQALQDQGSTVAAKMNSDLSQMRQKVDDFRKSFRPT